MGFSVSIGEDKKTGFLLKNRVILVRYNNNL
jgi:hypothetical protein